MGWVPGYWTKAKSDCRWVGGFWAHQGEEELAYVPPPPAPRDEPPPRPEGDGQFWVPGNWQYVEEEYRWKPGFWSEGREGFVWTPDCYAWTPRGFIFVRGYWDVPVESRGMLLAPLAVTPGVVRQVSPSVLIDVREALVHWFVGPTLRHYYFGDYYELPRGSAPVYSWYDYAAAGSKYDPMLAYFTAYDAQRLESLKTKYKKSKGDAKYRPLLTWSDYAGAGGSGLAYALSGQRLPAGLAPLAFSGEDLGAVSGYYRSAVEAAPNSNRERSSAKTPPRRSSNSTRSCLPATADCRRDWPRRDSSRPASAVRRRDKRKSTSSRLAPSARSPEKARAEAAGKARARAANAPYSRGRGSHPMPW